MARLADALAGVRRTAPQGLAEWRYHGRLVARRLDDAHLVIRADFDYRDSLLRQFPGTFSVPARFTKHMMIVADIARGEAGAIEDALEAAWQLQRSTARCPQPSPSGVCEPPKGGSRWRARRWRAGQPRRRLSRTGRPGCRTRP